MAPPDEATNKATTISLIPAEGSTTTPTVDTIEPRLWTSLISTKDLDSRTRKNKVVTGSIISL